MNLRLPVLAAVVTAATAVAAFRALRHEPAAANAGFIASAGSAAGTGTAGAGSESSAPPGDAAAASPREPGSQRAGALAGAASSAGHEAQRRFSNGLPGAVSGDVTVYVAGEVARAGVYALPASARCVDALKAAGGAIRGADLVAVNLAEPLRDGEEIVVPKIGAAPPSDTVTGTGTVLGGATDPNATPRAHRHRKKRRKRRVQRPDARGAVDAGVNVGASPPDAENAGSVVDLNSADENELETLPGIGASLAERIVAFREANGPYASPDDLLDVGGMTQSRLDAIVPYVTTR
jgi:competence protein ComEA